MGQPADCPSRDQRVYRLRSTLTPVAAEATSIAPPIATTIQAHPESPLDAEPPVWGAAAGRRVGDGVAVDGTAPVGAVVGEPAGDVVAVGAGDGDGVCVAPATITRPRMEELPWLAQKYS